MLTLTESAQQKVTQTMAEQQLEGCAMRLAIVGRGVESFAYDLALIDPTSARDIDQCVDVGPFAVYVDAETAPLVEDAVINYTPDRGFWIDNPEPVWTDPLGREVARIIATQINPGVAAHGGGILLADVRDDVVYVRMFGGCQGCGLASMTLRDGVEKTIKEQLPQIREVVDITQHALGTAPYYKK
jgi:Fe/S biogenesis protein NfuA